MGDWFYRNWEIDDKGFAEEHINVKELYIVLLAARKWACVWKDNRVLVHVDNVVDLIIFYCFSCVTFNKEITYGSV